METTFVDNREEPRAPHEKELERFETLHRDADAKPHARTEEANQALSAPPIPESRSWFRRSVAVFGAAALVTLLFIAGRPVWNYLQSYESTDDAEIDGHIA